MAYNIGEKELTEMEKMVHQYFDWMLTVGYSEATVESRVNDMRDFFNWCKERSINRCNEVSKKIIERYRRHMYHYRKSDGQPLCAKTQSHRLVAIRGFFKWLSKNNYVLYNPAADIELPRVGSPLPRNVLSVEEVEAVMNEVDLESPYGLRDRAILETLYSTGTRRRELTNLTLNDLNLSRGTLLIRAGKWRKDRLIPIGERAQFWVDRYIREKRPRLVVEPDEGYLFLNRQGEMMNYKYLGFLVSRYVSSADIGKRGSCHLFRHTMATMMLEGGADIRFIQQMLGHSKLETTQIYTKVAISKLKEIHAKTHPGALLERKSRDLDSP
jgi:integrase/recombinase XerD